MQYFAGGCLIIIVLVHGMSHSQVSRCIWLVVDTVITTIELDVQFPSNHSRQQKMQGSSMQKKIFNFPNCVGSINNFLVWIHKPNEEHCDLCQVGLKKLYAGESTNVV